MDIRDYPHPKQALQLPPGTAQSAGTRQKDSGDEGAGYEGSTGVGLCRKRKLGDYIDQGDETTFRMLPNEDARKVREEHETATGGEPSEAARPTSEQLCALHALVKAGCAPYADFAVFGVFGKRAAKLRRFEARILVDGQWVTKMLNGPSCFEGWQRSWKVFRP